ncbi:translation initiation factor IF-2-like [Onychostruthus taczanowskii]|uniref:translation initiation factor IF-2-like n=1 Tax=Onychostruthus taczanowskii TaxID=356909 RepID=UPI001B806FF5|nr:translation initiation factor IF-2-like [Onychostruthus taczanowskii]
MSVQRKTTGGLPQTDFKSSPSDPGAGEGVPPRLPGTYQGDMYLSKQALKWLLPPRPAGRLPGPRRGRGPFRARGKAGGRGSPPGDAGCRRAFGFQPPPPTLLPP